MNKLFAFIFFAVSFSSAAQDCKTSAGTKTLYHQQQLAYAAPPAGYQPVFINHVGRHGARHLTKDVNTYFAFKLLMRADSLHVLTKEGEQLKKMVLILRDIEAPHLKSISERGKAELEGIAARMIKNSGALIKQKPLNVKVEVTSEIRTSQSAAAFLNRIKQTNAEIKINETIDDTALRFYDLSPAYLKFEDDGNWKASLAAIQSALNKEAVFETFAGKFFNKNFIESAGEKAEFGKDIYGFATIVNSIISEAEQAGQHVTDLNFRPFFSCAQLKILSKADEAEDFLLKGPGEDTMGIQVKIAAPLLVEFINAADEYVNGNPVSLQLRFAHAETIAPFAALMQISSASRRANKLQDFNKTWKAEEVIPLSANIQWIFYQKKNSKDYLVKFMLNEKEVRIKGLSSKTYPFYGWKDVRQFYCGILQTLHLGLSDDMKTYLSNLRQ